jgi:ParB family chromosome partitioning protein
MRIRDVAVGIRHRHEMGDIDSLAGSMGQVGLLHPIVVTKDGALIAGERRLEPTRQLGWTEIPARRSLGRRLGDFLARAGTRRAAHGDPGSAAARYVFRAQQPPLSMRQSERIVQAHVASAGLTARPYRQPKGSGSILGAGKIGTVGAEERSD